MHVAGQNALLVRLPERGLEQIGVMLVQSQIARVTGSYEQALAIAQAVLARDDVAWFEFRELCDGPRSQNDYIELGKIYHAVILSNVEQMSVAKDDMARRFINLVDEFYDRNVKLIISAEVELKDLYTGGRLTFEFQRTLSRLLEMQSHEFLSRPHKP